ncbi:hypothetical protein FK484_0072 [Listeria phage LP-031]|uniref:Uncharacterized protein n=1 Tax=Listeria phage LP-031 TaxID=2590049 RepID=A0A514U7C1_9CAUD|nr:hypothetical protein FK484_0072 [Listeria phage LP-031]
MAKEPRDVWIVYYEVLGGVEYYLASSNIDKLIFRPSTLEGNALEFPTQDSAEGMAKVANAMDTIQDHWWKAKKVDNTQVYVALAPAITHLIQVAVNTDTPRDLADLQMCSAFFNEVHELEPVTLAKRFTREEFEELKTRYTGIMAIPVDDVMKTLERFYNTSSYNKLKKGKAVMEVFREYKANGN